MNNNDQRTCFLFLQLLILKKNEIFTITFLSGLKWMTAWRQLINKLTLYGYLRHSCINSNFHLIHAAPLLTLLYTSNIIILILVGHYLFAWIFSYIIWNINKILINLSCLTFPVAFVHTK